jgi:hypothetical protein
MSILVLHPRRSTFKASRGTVTNVGTRVEPAGVSVKVGSMIGVSVIDEDRGVGDGPD